MNMGGLKTYNDFLERVETLGFLFLTDVCDSCPSVSCETDGQQWHTGDPLTDPWQWKDRAAAEKRLAFGCLLGGHKGFIAPWLHADFVLACQPAGALEERWLDGSLPPRVWSLWQRFEDNPVLGSNDLSAFWKASGQQGTSGLDGALKDLQREFWITVAGNRQKRNRQGEPYGWPHLLYERLDSWLPASWPVAAGKNRADARSRILETGRKAAPGLTDEALSKLLRFKP
jgi:hypothetical protein